MQAFCRAKVPAREGQIQSTLLATHKATMGDFELGPVPKAVKENELTNNEWVAAVSMLLGMEMTGSLRKGSIVDVAKLFGVWSEAMSCLWNRAKTSWANSRVCEEEVRNRRPQEWDVEVMDKAVQELPYKKRYS